ncbi:MAG: alkyl sulfatase dimerization domain-containing protein [Pseudomonadales bacterium]|nr:alkyl sulfatase dimerization domain-containing protein [Pseudomonadales bacterium]
MSDSTHAFRVGEVTTGSAGQVAHPQHLAHSERLKEVFYAVGDSAWCYVGNGLSNQTFIKAPEGIIAIDTGECKEEMRDAIAKLREYTNAPIVACIYTHFHYVAGTTAIVEDRGDDDFPIYGHDGIAANLTRFGGEVGPRGSRGMVHQFAMMLPESGPDGIVNIGLGRFYRNPSHAPFTPGHMPATHTFTEQNQVTIAGLDVVFYPAPSDATDSVNICFPQLNLAVNNIFWPALFNIFAIRGEEYRDPRVLLNGLDELAGLNVEHQIGTHGPPMSGRSEVRASILRYRDSIQFIWDQTVRAANQGLTIDQAIERIKLPLRHEQDFRTQQLYGVVEHHVRQVYTGLFGWFDEDPSKLFPTPQPERAGKMIAAFGGRDAARALFDTALMEEDYRWALEVGSYLVFDQDPQDATQDKLRLAAALRAVAYCSSAANVRNWCLTQALELDGSIDLARFKIHRFRVQEILGGPADRWVPILRVLLDPLLADGVEASIGFEFDDGGSAGLMIRNQVAAVVAFDQCDLKLSVTKAAWAKLLGGKVGLSEVLAQMSELSSGDLQTVTTLLSCFDLESFKR